DSQIDGPSAKARTDIPCPDQTPATADPRAPQQIAESIPPRRHEQPAQSPATSNTAASAASSAAFASVRHQILQTIASPSMRTFTLREACVDDKIIEATKHITKTTVLTTRLACSKDIAVVTTCVLGS